MAKTWWRATSSPCQLPHSGCSACASSWRMSAGGSCTATLTKHPTAQWTAQQIVDAFPWDEAPRSLIRDRDGVYGEYVQRRVKNRGIAEVTIAPRSPWQHPYCERVIGSIRRDALDQVIVLNERHLRRVLRFYVAYYHDWRTHLSLEMDAPASRAVQPPELGTVRKRTEVSGLQYHCERTAA